MGETGGPVTKGRAGWWQGTSKINIQAAIGNVLHAAGKAHSWNPYVPRADFMSHTDMVMAEDSYEDERMHLLGLLGVGGKPVLSWNPGCDVRPSSQCGRYANSGDNAILLQRLLFWGLQPMLPVDGNDHAITRWQAEHGGDIQVFVSYGPLFKAMRGRKWAFSPHPVQATFGDSDGGHVNVFTLPNKVVGAPVVLASPHTVVYVTFSGALLQQHLQLGSGTAGSSNDVSATLLSPGHDAAVISSGRTPTGDLKVAVKLGSAGSALILLQK